MTKIRVRKAGLHAESERDARARTRTRSKNHYKLRFLLAKNAIYYHLEYNKVPCIGRFLGKLQALTRSPPLSLLLF